MVVGQGAFSYLNKGAYMKIKAAVIREAGQPFVIEEVDLAGPRDDEVLIRNVASGVCHTDVVAQQQIIKVPLPAVLGHEGSGIIEETGKNVVGLQKGDHVVVSYAYCGVCEPCLEGRPADCANTGVLNFGGGLADGSTRLSQNGKPLANFFGQSSFATYSVANQRSVVKIDPDVDVAMTAPLGCGVQTGAGAVLNKFKPGFGSTLAVIGVGTVGMSAIIAGRAAGCLKVVAIGGNAKSLELALKLGATHTINRKEVDDIGAKLKEITGGGAHFLFDTAGVQAMIQAGLSGLRRGGTFCSVAAGGGVNQFPYSAFAGKNVVPVTEGSAVSKLFIPYMIEYQKQGRFPFDQMNTFYDFADINKAVEESGDGKVIKAVIRF
jgi:aryl-alcohol dehydrogenase